MKKTIAMVLMLVMLLTSFIYASPNSRNMVTMLMDGRNTDFHVAGLKMFGEKIETDVPPVLHNSRTLLPVRFVAESMGAEVEWDQEQYAATITTEDKEILLMIDSPLAVVNGEIKPLPDEVAPKILTYKGSGRTMVPVRFVAEVLGLEVDWDNDTRTAIINYREISENEGVVENIRFTKGGVFPEIRIQTGKEVEFSTFRLSNPSRLVFDLENTKFDLKENPGIASNSTLNKHIGERGIVSLRASQFKTNPLTTRIVVELEEDKNHKTYYDEATGEMVISFINYVTSVTTETMNMREAIVIKGDYVKNYNMMKLQNPNRLVVDIKDSFLDYSGNIQNFIVDSNNIKGIRISEFQPDHHYKPEDKISRVVLDLYETYDINKMEYIVEEDLMIIFLEGKPLETLQYEETDWTTSTFRLTSNVVTNYDFRIVNSGRRLEISIPKSDIQLPLETIRIDDHIIDKITINEDNRRNEYIVEIQLKEGVEYKVISPGRGKEFLLELSNKDLKYREMLIVIDPGHGGSDPGAISPVKKIRESDLALDVSHRLNKLLVDAGFRTYMTRDKDTTVSLVDRAAVANQLEADLFVSVHANAFLSTSANGVETLYYPSENDPKDHRNNKRVAQIFQNQMVKTLGRRDRGIIPRDRVYVLRETEMPAVLTEIGFLTNPEEEALLATEAYKQLAAEAMFQAITTYFEEINNK
ncbi:MAG: N-acetylmuramoyl-L-alanine amidase [Clostridiaceae bacterium]|nr:N-acetylmuramoyl-L-alanine amidase [Clostridiaceae bacterium]